MRFEIGKVYPFYANKLVTNIGGKEIKAGLGEGTELYVPWNEQFKLKSFQVRLLKCIAHHKVTTGWVKDEKPEHDGFIFSDGCNPGVHWYNQYPHYGNNQLSDAMDRHVNVHLVGLEGVTDKAEVRRIIDDHFKDETNTQGMELLSSRLTSLLMPGRRTCQKPGLKVDLTEEQIQMLNQHAERIIKVVCDSFKVTHQIVPHQDEIAASLGYFDVVFSELPESGVAYVTFEETTLGV